MFDPTSKESNIQLMNNYMFTKTLSMFEYANLPDTIPQKELEKQLQQNGYCFITKVKGELYAFQGGIGGIGDVYGNATQITISNPYLKFNDTLDLKNDGVLIENDDLRLGLTPFFNKLNYQLAENDINLSMWGYNSRTQNLISASDDKTKTSAEQYVKNIVDGKLTTIGESALFDGIRLQSANSNGTSNVKSMLEYHQYLKASLYNEVGLSANFNMKKERLISSELDQAEDSLFPLVYNMMQNRIKAVNMINEMYGTNIEVDFGSVWFHKHKQLVDGVIEDENSELENVGLDSISNQTGEVDIKQEGEKNPEELEQEQEREQAPELEPEIEPVVEDENELDLIEEQESNLDENKD